MTWGRRIQPLPIVLLGRHIDYVARYERLWTLLPQIWHFNGVNILFLGLTDQIPIARLLYIEQAMKHEQSPIDRMRVLSGLLLLWYACVCVCVPSVFKASFFENSTWEQSIVLLNYTFIDLRKYKIFDNFPYKILLKES
jgi:hypothetical protein